MVSYEHLNPSQQQAVSHTKGPLLILAGAGSGKTRVLTYRLAELVQRGVRPHRILAVTFTNKAAQEMRERAEKLLPGTSQGMWIGTFHSLFGRLLRIYAKSAGLPNDFLVFDAHDQKTLCEKILKELRVSERISSRAIAGEIDQAKNQGISASEYRGKDYFTDVVAKIYPVYQQRLLEAAAVDFGDLLLVPLKLWQRDEALLKDFGNRFDYVLVDEFQDVNWVQYQLVCLAAQRTRELLVVGDDDQAIYSWRGADVRNLLAFEKDWPDATLIKLEQNYRSTSVILEAAHGVIARNRHRYGKKLFCAQLGGNKVVVRQCWDERREAEYVIRTLRELPQEDISLAECAVFYRTNAQSRVLEETLRAAGIPYTVVGGMRFYDRAEVRDVLAYLRVCHNPQDEVALQRIINVPARGIGEATVQKIEQAARSQNVNFWQAIQASVSTDEILGATVRKKLVIFAQMINQLRQNKESQSLANLADSIIEATGYLDRLAMDPSPEAVSKRENVLELMQSIREWSQAHPDLSLGDYLDQVALVSTSDTPTQGVSLMTIHAAKGLEFEAVFVTGLEDGLFPSRRSQDGQEEVLGSLEEERRLMYVAMTRAKKRLFLTYAKQRKLYGALPRINDPSPFLADVPEECIHFESDAPAEPIWSFGKSWNPALPFRATRPSFQENVVIREEEFSSPRFSSNAHSVVEYEDGPQTRGSFRVGQKVSHSQFGVGEVRGFSGTGERLKLIVSFAQVGAKTILAQFVTPL